MRAINEIEVMVISGGIPLAMGGNPFGAGPESSATGSAQDTTGSFFAGYVVGVIGSVVELLSQ